MQQTIQALRALQELDHEIYRLRDELRRLPEERAQRRAAIDALIARKDEAAKRALESRLKIKEIDDLTTIQRQRIRKVESEAAGARNDMALQAAFQHQVKSLKKEINQAEEEGLAMLSDAEAVEGEAKKIKVEIDAAEKLFAEFAANVESESKLAQAKLKELEKQRRSRMSNTIEPENLALYDRLLLSRGGIALAELETLICQACFIQVPRNLYVRVARSDKLVQCPSCDRIFYVRD